MLDGWIKLHRKIRENPVFNDMQLFRLWIICLTEATYKERDQLIGKQVIHLLPGEFVTGRFDLQGMYNRGLTGEQQKSPATVWRWLEVLKNGDFVSIKSSNKFSVVSILSWHKYQSDEQQNDEQMSNRRATDEQQMSTNKKEKKDNKKPSCPKRVYDEQSLPYRTANYLYTNILKFKPDLKKPNLQNWANDMRMLIELDKKDPKEIGQVIDWVTNDQFWQVNILSASKLREKWDAVTARMKQDNYRPTNKQQTNLQVVQPTEQDRKEIQDAIAKQRERNGLPTAING